MNILMLGWELPPNNSGGLGVACYQMSKALAQKGATIDFVLPDDPGMYKYNHMKVHGIDKAFKQKRSTAYTGNIGQIRNLQTVYAARVKQIATTKKPDVIHVHDWLTMEAGLAAKKITNSPLVVHVHATEFDRSGGGYGNPVIHDIERSGLLMADEIIAVSNLTKNIIHEKYDIPLHKITVLHNASSSDELSLSNDASTYSYLDTLKQNGYTVVTVLCRLTIQKGLDHFLQAAALAHKKYDKLVFLIAGDGEQRNELIELSASLGIADSVFFTGFVKGQQWRDAYRVSDIFVLSSVSEPFGITALEAAAWKNAVVLTKQSGVSEVLQNVIKYDFWDHKRLADILVGIARSRALRLSLAKDVQSEYSKLSWKEVALQCEHVYQKAMEQEPVYA